MHDARQVQRMPGWLGSHASRLLRRSACHRARYRGFLNFDDILSVTAQTRAAISETAGALSFATPRNGSPNATTATKVALAHFLAPDQALANDMPQDAEINSVHADHALAMRKRLDRCSADPADLLYPIKAYKLYQPCGFKPEAPDDDRYPLARKTKCLSVTLNPGALIIQPAGWFHQVYALDSPNMSVSYFWRY